MYLDPSFGGMLLQVIIAVIAGGGAIAFGMRRKIKDFFKKKKDITDISSNAPTTEGELVDMMDSSDEKK